MSVAWEEFLPEVLLEVDDCPQALAVSAIRNAAITLCKKSRVWREYLDAITVKTGQADYELDQPTDTNIVMVVSARCGADPNKIDMKGPFSEKHLDRDLPGWRNYTANIPSVFLFDGTITMTLVGTPTEDITNGLLVRVALKPTTTASEGPDILLADYHEAIGYGAKARLMAMPEKEWSNPNLSMYYDKLFARACVDAWAKAARGNGTKDLRANDQSFGGLSW